MLKKKVITGALVFMLASISLMPVGVQAAGNYSDTAYTYIFNNSMRITNLRPKYDNTSSYMKCVACPDGTSYTAHVVAAKSNASGEPRYDVSNGHTYIFTKGTSNKMINYAKEWGYSYAGIAAMPNYSYGFNANVLWSPDSI